MSLDKKGKRYCDECGQSMLNAHRLYKGNEYCSSCYPRVFISTPCSCCKKQMRAHRHALRAICRQCDRETRQCLRCERPVMSAALIVGERPVCASCARYFSNPEPCAWCGTITVHLSRALQIGVDEKVCNSCRSRLTHRTCATCRRYRPIAGLLPNGRPHCAACVPGVEQEHPCPSCGLLIAGSGEGKCVVCLNGERIRRHTAIQILALDRSWTRNAYSEFGQWLMHKQSSVPNLVKTLSSHFRFFERLDVAISDPLNIQGDGLLEHFKVAELRRHVLPIRFLELHAGVALDEDAKLDQAEHTRIAEKLISVRNEPCGVLLKQYSKWLQDQQMPVRTIRLYLTAATHLCLDERLGVRRECSDEMLKRFLRKRPGSRASLFRWLAFCRTILGWDLKMPTPSSRTNKPPRTVRDLSVLLAKIDAVGTENAPILLLQRAIAKTFGFRAKQMNSTKWTLQAQGEVIYLVDLAGSVRVRVPTPMQELVTTWMRKALQ